MFAVVTVLLLLGTSFAFLSALAIVVVLVFEDVVRSRRAAAVLVAVAVAALAAGVGTYQYAVARAENVVTAVENRYDIEIEEAPNWLDLVPGRESSIWTFNGAKWDCRVGDDLETLSCYAEPVGVLRERVEPTDGRLDASRTDTDVASDGNSSSAPSLPFAMTGR